MAWENDCGEEGHCHSRRAPDGSQSGSEETFGTRGRGVQI